MIGIDCGSSIRPKDRVRINTCGEIFSTLLDYGDSNSLSVCSCTKGSPANEEYYLKFTVESLELFVVFFHEFESRSNYIKKYRFIYYNPRNLWKDENSSNLAPTKFNDSTVDYILWITQDINKHKIKPRYTIGPVQCTRIQM